jgi:DnaK suppressor protein
MIQATKLTQFRDKLHALRAHLDAQAMPVAEPAPDVTDFADRATQQREIAVSIGLAEHESLTRNEIDAALQRMAAGTFGKCEICQAEIGARRLDAIPYVRYCITCEQQVEVAAAK